MSAAICWEPAKVTRARINIGGAPSSFMGTMKAAGLELPCEVSHGDLPVLRGMACAYPYEPNPYIEITNLINKHGAIRLFAEY